MTRYTKLVIGDIVSIVDLPGRTGRARVLSLQTLKDKFYLIRILDTGELVKVTRDQIAMKSGHRKHSATPKKHVFSIK